MSRLKKIIQLVCLFFILAFVGVTLHSKVQAQGCQIYRYCYFDEGAWDEICTYYDGCGDNWDYCPPNFYRAPDGSCRENGASVACGEWYACPTANNPGKQCKNTCGSGDACRAGKVDCPAGSVINLNQVISTSCDVVNSESLCGGRGSAQRSYSDAARCCRMVTIPAEYSDWYCGSEEGPDGKECGYKSNGDEKCCRDEISPKESYCSNPQLVTYGCTSTCNATAPSGVSVVQGSSPTVANVSWTSGTNGVSQLLRVDEDLAEVNTGCLINPTTSLYLL